MDNIYEYLMVFIAGEREWERLSKEKKQVSSEDSCLVFTVFTNVAMYFHLALSDFLSREDLSCSQKGKDN